MLARARLNQRQEVFAARIVSLEFLSRRQIAPGPVLTSAKIKRAAGLFLDTRTIHPFERGGITTGMTFPGAICLPPAVREKEEERKGDREAISFASQHRAGPDFIWTDGSAFEGGLEG